MINILDCLKVRSLSESTLHLTNIIAYNHKRGYVTGIDNKTYWDIAPKLGTLLTRLQRQISSNNFIFKPCRKITRQIKYKIRDLYISTWEDRIIERWLNDSLNILLNNWLSPHSYAYRTNLGLDRCQRNVKKVIKPNIYILKRDISNYFYSIDHNELLKILSTLVEDDLLQLIKQRIIFNYDAGNGTETATIGIPFGSSLACCLSNIYLTATDQAISNLQVKYFRYADDFLIICPDEGIAKEASTLFDLELERLKLKQKASHKLDINLDKSTQSIKCLGLNFQANGIISLSREKFRKIRNLFKRNLNYRIKEINKAVTIDDKLQIIVEALNETISDRIRSVAIIDYYLKHINNEEQLKNLDMLIAQMAISTAIGKPFRFKYFSVIPYNKLRSIGLISLLHRKRLLAHNNIKSSFMSIYNELNIKRYLSAIAKRRDRINQMNILHKLKEAMGHQNQHQA